MDKILYYAHITHDGLKSEVEGKQKVLVYLAEARDAGDAEKQFRSLESEFQVRNFKISHWARLTLVPNRPLLMGIELQQV